MQLIESVHRWLTLIAALLTSGGNFAGGQTPRLGGSTLPITREGLPPLVGLPENADHVVLPLSRAGDWLCTKVRIDGTDAGWFVIDTGATTTAIDKTLVEKLGLKRVGRMTVRGMFDSVMDDVVECRQLDVGPVAMRHGIMASIDLSSTNLAPGFKIAGILGNDLLREQPFSIDFPAATLTLYRRDRFIAPEGITPETLKIRGDLPQVRGRVEGHEGWFLVDSGDSGPLRLDYDFVWQHYSRTPGKHLSYSSIAGLAGPVGIFNATLGPIEFFGRGHPELRVMVPMQESHNYTAGGIGARAMAEGRFTFNYSAGQIWVQWQKSKSTEDMLKQLGDPHNKDLIGRTPLMIAAEKGRADVVSVLMKRGAAVNAKDSGEFTPLIEASSSSHPDIVKLLLDAGADANATCATRGLTALHFAAMEGDVDSVRTLLEAGANINATDTNGMTALMYAAASDYLEVVRALLDAHAEFKVAAKDGRTALSFAAAWAELRVLELLVEKGADVNPSSSTPLQAAAGAGQVANAKFLLEHTAKVDVADSDGKTPLMLAAEDGNEAVVLLMLSAGADRGLRSTEGKTAADYATNPFALRAIVQWPERAEGHSVPSLKRP